MATTTPETGPAAAAGPTPAIAPLTPGEIATGEAMYELASGAHADVDRACNAMASLMELLQGCNDGYSITASYLVELLTPVHGCMETAAVDMLTLLKADNWIDK